MLRVYLWLTSRMDHTCISSSLLGNRESKSKAIVFIGDQNCRVYSSITSLNFFHLQKMQNYPTTLLLICPGCHLSVLLIAIKNENNESYRALIQRVNN